MKQELIEIICRKSFKYTETPSFKLVSGRMSCFYVNCKPTTLSPRGMFLVGHLVFDIIKDLKPDGIGGLTFGADPMAMATAFVSELKESPINAFSIRKTRKDHGIVKWVEGDVQPGQRVVIIDDVAGQGYVGENAEAVKLVGDSLSSDWLGFIFPKGSDLVEKTNSTLQEMMADGFLDALNLKYFGPDFTITYDDIIFPE